MVLIFHRIYDFCLERHLLLADSFKKLLFFKDILVNFLQLIFGSLLSFVQVLLMLLNLFIFFLNALFHFIVIVFRFMLLSVFFQHLAFH